MAKKFYKEFNDIEKQAIDKLASAYFEIDMCDNARYFSAFSNKRGLLEKFNQEFGYNFSDFIPDYNNNEDNVYFEIPLTEEEKRVEEAKEEAERLTRIEAYLKTLGI